MVYNLDVRITEFGPLIQFQHVFIYLFTITFNFDQIRGYIQIQMYFRISSLWFFQIDHFKVISTVIRHEFMNINK